MSQQITVQNTSTLAPSGYSSANSSYSSISSSYPVSNGYTDATSTSYAYITCRTGSRASSYISYTFNVSEIPDNATIDSITCTAKVRVSSTSYISTAYLQLYNNATAMGSQTSARTTTNGGTTYTLTPGTWNRSQLDNIQIRYTATRGTSNTSSAAYMYFYGATLTITYTVSDTQYTIAATSNVSEYTISPETQGVMRGQSCYVDIPATTLDEIIVTDNDTDVTSSFVRHTAESGSYTSTFIPSSFDSTNSMYNTTAGDTNNGIYSTNYINNGLTDHTSTTRCALYARTGSGTQSWMYYNFDCSSIPQNATITSVSCQFKGGTQGSSYYSSYTAQLTTGTTTKGTAQSVTGSNSSPTTVTISGGSWTRAELNDIKIKFMVTRGSSNTTTDSTWSFFGATLTVQYTVTPENPYYWRYTLNNVNADHVIIINFAGAYEPPEEDPQYTYESLTISSINAITEPVNNGTIRVVQGTNQTITITPTDPQLTLALDNGVDITSQLQGGVPSNTYTVTTDAPNASYGFTLNNNTGYYVSENAGRATSAAVCRVNFTCESACLVTIQFINYAEATYDYGIFGNVDEALDTTSTADSNAYLTCSTSAQNTNTPQTVTYNLTAGNHYIDIKYRKDSYTDSNNDNLQWKILSIEATQGGGEYTYTITNIQARHSLIFVFGDVDYYIITSNGTNCRLFPDGQQVKLAGQSYTLTIVPDDTEMTATILDNTVDRTSYLEYVEGTNKDNEKVVNYVYKLTNLATAHNLVITCATNGPQIFLKINGSWVACSKVYQKVNGSWTEVADPTSLFSTTGNYQKMN